MRFRFSTGNPKPPRQGASNASCLAPEAGAEDPCGLEVRPVAWLRDTSADAMAGGGKPDPQPKYLNGLLRATSERRLVTGTRESRRLVAESLP